MYNVESSFVFYRISPRAAQFAYGVYIMHDNNENIGYSVVTDKTVDSALPDIMNKSVIDVDECHAICEYYREKWQIQTPIPPFIDWLLTHDVSDAIPLYIRTRKGRTAAELELKQSFKSDKFGNANKFSYLIDAILDEFIQKMFDMGKSSLDRYEYDRNPTAYIRHVFQFFKRDATNVTDILNQKTVTDELKENFSKQDVMISQDYSLDIGKCLMDINNLYKVFFDETTNPYTLYVQKKHADEIDKFIKEYFPALKLNKNFDAEGSTRRNKWSNRVKLFDYFCPLCEKDFTYVDLLNAYKCSYEFNVTLQNQNSGYGLFKSSKNTQNGYSNDEILQLLYDGLYAIRRLYNYCKKDNNVFLSSCVFEQFELVNAIKSKYVLYYDFDLIETNVTGNSIPVQSTEAGTADSLLQPTNVVSSALIQNNDLINIIQMIQRVKISEIKTMPTNRVNKSNESMIPLTLYNDITTPSAVDETVGDKIKKHIVGIFEGNKLEEICFDVDFGKLCLLTSRLFVEHNRVSDLSSMESMYKTLKDILQFEQIDVFYSEIMQHVSKNERLTLKSVECNFLLFARHSYVVFSEYAKVCRDYHLNANGAISKVYLKSFLQSVTSTHEYAISQKTSDFKFRNIFAFMLDGLDSSSIHLPTNLIEYSRLLRINSYEEPPSETVLKVIKEKTPMFIHGYAFDGFDFIMYENKYIHQLGFLVNYQPGLNIVIEKIEESYLPIIYGGQL